MNDTQPAPPASPLTAGSSTGPAPGAATRTDEDRERDAAVFLVVVWMIARFFAYFAGFKLAEYTPEERKKDAFAWVPVARRYGSFDTLITWVAVPAVLMQRIESKMRRKGDTRGDAAVASEAKH
jgi:hypothetical protein